MAAAITEALFHPSSRFEVGTFQPATEAGALADELENKKNPATLSVNLPRITTAKHRGKSPETVFGTVGATFLQIPHKN